MYEINVVRYSNLTAYNEKILTVDQLLDLTSFMFRINREFKVLYGAEDNDDFAIDIEYKITSEDQLIIKQARPWAYYWADQIDPVLVNESNITSIELYPNPSSDILNIRSELKFSAIHVISMEGKLMFSQMIDANASKSQIDISSLNCGSYIIVASSRDGQILINEKIIKI